MVDIEGNEVQGDQNVQQVNRVNVKAPVFYRGNPTVWFRQMESQFVVAGVTESSTKFHYIMSALPEDVAMNLASEVTGYDDLKAQILGIYQKSKQELLEDALGSVSLDGQKPSVCLLRIKRKLSECNLVVDNDVLKHRLLQAMPYNTRTSLSAHTNLEPEDFAKLADTIYGYAQAEHRVSMVDNNERAVAATTSRNYQTNRQNQQHPPQNGGMEQNFQLRPFANGQKPKICRFHLYYASAAKRCKPWCKWPGQKPAAIDPSSRPSSPAPSSRPSSPANNNLNN